MDRQRPRLAKTVSPARKIFRHARHSTVVCRLCACCIARKIPGLWVEKKRKKKEEEFTEFRGDDGACVHVLVLALPQFAFALYGVALFYVALLDVAMLAFALIAVALLAFDLCVCVARV